MRLLFILTLAFLALPCIAQTAPPKDVDGWQGARWGMTADELQKVFGSQLVKREKRDRYFDSDPDVIVAYVDYFIPLELAGEQFKANLKMDIKTDKLSGINVQTAEDQEYASTAERIFEDLEKALGQKYGPPGYVDDKRQPHIKSYTRVRRWTFPTTTIELRLGVGMWNIVQIIYEPTRNKDVDKL